MEDPPAILPGARERMPFVQGSPTKHQQLDRQNPSKI